MAKSGEITAQNSPSFCDGGKPQIIKNEEGRRRLLLLLLLLRLFPR